MIKNPLIQDLLDELYQSTNALDNQSITEIAEFIDVHVDDEPPLFLSDVNKEKND